MRSRAPATLAHALAKWAARGPARAFYLAQIDAVDARAHPFATEFLRAGFVDGGKALLLRARAASRDEAPTDGADAGR